MEENKCHCKEETCGCNCHDDYRDPNCTCGSECHCNDVTCECDECHCEDHECKCDESCDCHEDKKDKKKDKKKHKEEIKKFEDKIKQLEQDVLVAKADLINYRKRKDEEVTRLLKFCNEDLIKQILPIMDNFERAIKLDDDNLEDEVSKFLEGFKMIYCNMQNVMGNFDVKSIDGANIPFDPNYHNAIMVEQKEGVEPGMILEVLQKGYIYKDKVIRPAMVKVSE